MSHGELIAFLRQCPETVEFDLYREASRSQTPISPDDVETEDDLQIQNDLDNALRRPSAFIKEMVS